MKPLTRSSIANSAFPMLTMMIAQGVVNHTPILVSVGLPMVPPSPRNSDAKPRYESSQPESATHCRIQMTNPDITIEKPIPPPNTRL